MVQPARSEPNLCGELKPETVFRVHRHDRDYLQVANATVQDKRLSWGARGLLVYLLSLPSNWEIRVSHLIKQGDAGRDALRRMLHELQRHGYASGVGRESQERGSRGRFGPTEISIYETSSLNPFYSKTNSPSPENPSTVAPSPDSPSPENPSVYKVHSLQTTEEKKDGVSNTHTQKGQPNLRAVGAQDLGVYVNGKFPDKTYERYARNHQADIHKPVGWVSAAKRSGEWDERVARWCAEHALDPRTGESVGTPGEDAALSATSYGQPPLDAANCRDCEGRMLRPAAGPGDWSRGAVKCRHESLAGQGAT